MAKEFSRLSGMSEEAASLLLTIATTTAFLTSEVPGARERLIDNLMGYLGTLPSEARESLHFQQVASIIGFLEETQFPPQR